MLLPLICILHCCNLYVRSTNFTLFWHPSITTQFWHPITYAYWGITNVSMTLFFKYIFLTLNFTVVTSCSDNVSIVKLSNRSLVMSKQQMTLQVLWWDWPLIDNYCHLVTKYNITITTAKDQEWALDIFILIIPILHEIYNIYF